MKKKRVHWEVKFEVAPHFIQWGERSICGQLLVKQKRTTNRSEVTCALCLKQLNKMDKGKI